jgi:hypothetical protein
VPYAHKADGLVILSTFSFDLLKNLLMLYFLGAKLGKHLLGRVVKGHFLGLAVKFLRFNLALNRKSDHFSKVAKVH